MATFNTLSCTYAILLFYYYLLFIFILNDGLLVLKENDTKVKLYLNKLLHLFS